MKSKPCPPAWPDWQRPDLRRILGTDETGVRDMTRGVAWKWTAGRNWKTPVLTAALGAGLAVLAASCGPSAPSGDASHKTQVTPAQYCAQVQTDDALRRPPDSMMPAVRQIFGVSDDYPRAGAFYRCAEGKVMVCIVGANLPCGKANTSVVLPATVTWCRANSDADFIPMSVTGHETAYSWRCVNGAPVARRTPGTLDKRGFFAKNWKKLR